jgi:prepilin-type N-terminal cleavage/methylation domain-containing protein
MSTRSFTLTEVIIVVIVIGILVAFAMPQFRATKERSLDKEAKAAVALIQAAEKIYKMEEGPYYPWPAGSTSNITNINTWLKLSLPSSSGWTYVVDSANQQATATRNIAGGRTFTISFTSDAITCTPNSDTCPP